MERAILRLLQDHGLAAEKLSAMYRRGPDLSIPICGVDRTVECKVRAGGFQSLYRWLTGADMLIVKCDRGEPLVVIPLRLAAEIARVAERHKD